MIALDVGYGQLHPRLRDDPRVTVLERLNVREPGRAAVPAGARRLRRVVHLRDARRCRLRSGWPHRGWEAVVLVKPQFEAGRGEVGKGGVVTLRETRTRVAREVAGGRPRLGCGGRGRRRLGPTRTRRGIVSSSSISSTDRGAVSRKSSTAGSMPPSSEPIRRIAVLSHGDPEVIAGARARVEEIAATADAEMVETDDVDLAVVLGGDGTMLRALHQVPGHRRPRDRRQLRPRRLSLGDEAGRDG